jgi:methylmalonyl-CoA mutase N-terminal domain/subunit
MKDEGKLKSEFTRWEEGTLKGSIKRFPERKKNFITTSNVEIQRLYLPQDLTEEWYLEKLGFPGEYPFTRGVQPTMHRARYWTMRMYSGFATAEETNARYKFLLNHGQTGLSVAFDLPTQIGYDSDHPLAAGEVGRVGVAIDTLADMETLFDGIPLGEVSTNMTINSTAAILLAMYLAVAEKQGVKFKDVRGTIQNDILKEYVARGTYIFPPRPSMRIVADIFRFCRDVTPQWNTISICGYHIREAGSNAVQELAFTLANGIAYVQAGLEAGLEVDEFAQRIFFHFDTHNNFLEEIAKFRAARRLWARIMKERFGAKKPASCMLRLHAQGAGCSCGAFLVNLKKAPKKDE